MNGKGFNRWWIMVGAIIIQLCLGAIYAWSVFRKPLEKEPISLKTIPISEIEKIEILDRKEKEPIGEVVIKETSIKTGNRIKVLMPGKEIEGEFIGMRDEKIEINTGLTPTQATLPFALVLISFAIATIIGGRWQDKKGPRIVATAGGILLGLGLILSGISKTFFGTVISYGIISGIGIGLAYVCPISTGVKWFPDMRGLITGLSVAGFGAGALIVAPVARALIDRVQVFNTFIILGIVFLILIILAAQILRNPPEGYRPSGWQPSPTSTATTYGYTAQEMLSTHQFYLLWLIYFFGCATGLMIIGQTSPIGQDLAKVSKETAALAVSALAIFNALGRIFWGKISDIFGRLKTLFFVFLICGIAVLLYNLIPTLPFYYWIGVSLVGLCFGGYLAVFPAITADFYGTKNVGVNYGLLFTAYGVGGLLGNIFAPQVLEKTRSYNLAFLVSGVLCLIGMVTTLLIRQPTRRET
jgi:OFA family oxalate/formate antiporter-like MFS transporter